MNELMSDFRFHRDIMASEPFRSLSDKLHRGWWSRKGGPHHRLRALMGKTRDVKPLQKGAAQAPREFVERSAAWLVETYGDEARVLLEPPAEWMRDEALRRSSTGQTPEPRIDYQRVVIEMLLAHASCPRPAADDADRPAH